MLAYNENNQEEDNQNSESSKLEELVLQDENPVRAIVHELLERFVQDEFLAFIGPRIGHETDGKTVVEYRNGFRNIKQITVDTLALGNFQFPRSRTGGFGSSNVQRFKWQVSKFSALAL